MASSPVCYDRVKGSCFSQFLVSKVLTMNTVPPGYPLLFTLREKVTCE